LDKAIPLLKTLIMPLTIVLLALAVHNQGLLTAISSQAVVFTVWLLLVVNAALSIGFKKSRFFFVIVILIINHWFQTHYPGAKAIQPLLLILLPFNIFIFAALSERGITSTSGKASLGWLFFQLLAILGYLEQHQVNLTSNSPPLIPFLPNPIWPWLLVAFYLITLTAVNWIKLSRSYGAMVGILLAIYSGLMLTGAPLTWPIFSAAAALIILAFIVEDIYRLAFMDELTGLYSRRCFNLDLMRLSGNYTIAMIDIDHFKKINDTYGHDVGDQVLRYITSFMHRTPRRVKAYRYGGEEFAMVFYNVSKSEAVPYLEDLRKTMAKRPFIVRSQERPHQKPQSASLRPGLSSSTRINITVSIGAADNSRRNSQPHDVVVSADKALYQADKNGRNRTFISS